MKKSTKVLIGGNGSTFQYLSQQLSTAGYKTVEVSANPLDIQFESITSKPAAIFLNSSSDSIMMLIDNLKKIEHSPIIYVVQSPYEIVKNKKLEDIVNHYFDNPIDVKHILEVLKEDITKRDEISLSKSSYDKQIHNIVSETLNKLCVTPNYNGYMYLREAIKMSILEPVNSRGFSTRIYPKIAADFGVTPASIERNIRTAIIKSWEKASLSDKTDIFGVFSANSQWHPTNSEFILIIADKITREYAKTLNTVNV